MNFFKKIFSEATPENVAQKNNFSWIPLRSEEQLQNIVKQEQYSVIFKHSTRCSISRMALKAFEQKNKTFEKQIHFYYLDLLQYREISKKVAAITEVTHQSPQIILCKNGEILHHCSHQDIPNADLEKYL